MSKNDWWNGLYANPAGGKADRSDADSPSLVTVSPENAEVNTSGHRFPAPAHTWGGTPRTPDPFLQDNPPHLDASGNTPEEAAELRKHAEAAQSAPGQPEVSAPPEPVDPPTVIPAPDETKATADTPAAKKEDTDDEDAKGVQAILKILRERKDTVKEAKDKVGAKTEPARTAAQATATAVSSSFSGSWSFLWALAAAWTLSPTFPVALLDRIAMIFGSPRPLSGTERMDWGFLHGPGVWFGQQLDAYGASGNIGRLVLLCAIGAGPVLFAQLGAKIQSTRLRKICGWIAYGFPVFFICMPYYFDAMGFRTQEDLYITLLAASTWWGFSFSRTLEPGFWQFVLRIPLAAVIVGLGHSAPGAAF